LDSFSTRRAAAVPAKSRFEWRGKPTRRWFLKCPDRTRYDVTPLILCPTPEAIARSAFSDEIIDAHLDELAAQQQQHDGGWPITWEAPGAGAAIEWRGRFTLDALITLRAYGRI